MKKKDIKIRILNNIKIDDNGCWLMRPQKKNNGYAKMEIDGTNKRAHRMSYEAFIEPVPQGLLVLHHCDIRHCVNPEHLFVGTAKDNTQDMMRKGRAKFKKKLSVSTSLKEEV